jgi:hypothetical protein
VVKIKNSQLESQIEMLKRDIDHYTAKALEWKGKAVKSEKSLAAFKKELSVRGNSKPSEPILVSKDLNCQETTKTPKPELEKTGTDSADESFSDFKLVIPPRFDPDKFREELRLKKAQNN